MKTYLDCVPCFLRQSLQAARDLEMGEEAAAEVLRAVLALSLELDWSLPPPLMGREIHRLIREVSGHPDPYQDRKRAATESALRLLPKIEASTAAAPRPFHQAVRFSIAGNLIDLGAKSAREASVEEVVRLAQSEPLDDQAVERFQKELAGARTVLFITDNAGEIVFDRLLLDRIGPERLIVAVRGGPAINDATLEDAERSGLTQRYRVISSGADVPGTWLSACSPEFQEVFRTADMVVAKGQGNFETLSDSDRRIWFLLMAKCDIVARNLGLPNGSFVIQATD